MAHKTLVGGTAYEVSGGKTLVDGTGYEIAKGRTLVGGTGYDIPFTKSYLVRITGGWDIQAGSTCYVMIGGVTYNTDQELWVEEGTSIVVYCGGTERLGSGNIRVISTDNGAQSVATATYPSKASYDYTKLFNAETEIYITMGSSNSRVVSITSNDTQAEILSNTL